MKDGLLSLNPASVGCSLWIRSCGRRLELLQAGDCQVGN